MKINLGENIKRLRKEKGMTQEAFAREVGVSFQTVSKWERGDTYPDMEMLPFLSLYFQVSVDSLLGIDYSIREKQIEEYLDLFNKTSLKERAKLLEVFETANKEFPNDYRITVRYIELLIEEKLNICNDDFENVSCCIQTAYKRIIDHSTDDSIRIWAKRLMYRYLKYRYCCCGYNKSDHAQMLEIVETMPRLCDAREMLAADSAEYDSWDVTHEAVIDELLYYLQAELVSYCIDSEKFTKQYKINVLQHIIELIKVVDRDEKCSKNSINLIYSYGRLGKLYYEIKDIETSIKYLTASAKNAIKFDKWPDSKEITRHYDLGNNEFRQMSIASQMKEIFINRFSFSEDFKKSKAFVNVISILDDNLH